MSYLEFWIYAFKTMPFLWAIPVGLVFVAILEEK